MKAIEAIKTGWNLHAVLRGNWEACADLLEIRRLNERATAAWTRGNNSGDPAYLATQEKKSESCYQRAKAIADKRGWTIEQPGLWWQVRNGKGQDITPHL